MTGGTVKIIDQATASIDVGWTEPVLNADGTPLQDLAYTSAYYSVNNGPLIVGAKNSASNLQGGGPVTVTVIVPAPQGVTTKLAVTATATDTSGNESVAVPPMEITIERTAPSPVSNFTVA